jgi:hypothetical protein
MYRRMHDEFPILFTRQKASPSPSPQPRGVDLGIIGGLMFLPLFFLVALLSIPVMPVVRFFQKRRYERFKAEMGVAGRIVSWEYANGQRSIRNGTLVYENVTGKGAWSLWWTPDRIADVNPFPFPTASEKEAAAFGPDFAAFRKWCYQNYLDPIFGKAFLVEQVEKTAALQLLNDDECVKVFGVKSTRKN